MSRPGQRDRQGCDGADAPGGTSSRPEPGAGSAGRGAALLDTYGRIRQVASSSRSQLAMLTSWAALRLTWEAQSISVHGRLSLAGVIVTHLVTRPSYLELAWSPYLLIRSDLHGRSASAQIPSELAKPCSSMRSERRCCATLCGQNPANLSRCPGHASGSAGVKGRMTTGRQGIDSVRLPVRVPCQIRHGGSILRVPPR